MKQHIKTAIKLTLVSLIATLLPYIASAQQQFTYSQYMNNQTPLNPAYSLLDQNGSLNALFRKQWTGIDGSPSTFIFNGSMPIEAINGSAGVVVMNDQYAVEHLTE